MGLFNRGLTSSFISSGLVLMAAQLSACNGTETGDSLEKFGSAAGEIPATATEVSYEEFLALREAGQLRPVNLALAPVVLPQETKEETKTAVAGVDEEAEPSAELTDEEILADLEKHSPSMRRMLRVRPEINRSTEGDERLTKLKDGNYSLRWKDRRGNEHSTHTLGDNARRFGILWNAKKIRTRKSQKARELLLRQAREKLSAQAAAPTSPNGTLPSVMPAPTPAGVFQGPAACAFESGVGTGSDQSNSWGWCSEPSERGLVAHYDYPAKPFVSCVKNQANRGSCEAFANASATEMLVSMKNGGTHVNFSEQDIYFRTKMFWPSTFANFGDGAGQGWILDRMVENRYTPSFESSWDYNPANFRKEDSRLGGYKNSCKGYSQWCSDTSHQGQFFCARDTEAKLFCGFASQASEMGERGTGSVRSWLPLWDATQTETSLGNLVTILEANIASIVLEFDVTNDFMFPDKDGYGRLRDEELESYGAHASHLVGAISNERLAELIPDAPQGAGGGYLIIKNSWGPCAGDAGYYYMPYDWAKKYVIAASVVTGVY